MSKRRGADVAEGDFLCIYTGYGDLLLRDGEHVQAAALAACPGLDGTDKALLDWIDRSGLAAICADHAMVEKLEGVIRCDGKTAFEPSRVCRRRWVVSHAAISMLSAAA